VEEQRDVEYVGPLAGRDAGFYDENGIRLLVTHSPNVIEPEPGDWPTLGKLITGMFDDEQAAFVYGWLSVAYRALRERERIPGQALAMAGPANCGKSLLQNLFTLVLGGRSAKPYQFMSGFSQFNSDLFGAEHLMIEDEAASTDLRARRNMGALIKSFTVNEDQRCHAKGIDAVMLRPFWRVTITMNDEPENLMILPPLDESLQDKLMLFKVTQSTMPMPTTSMDQRKQFWSRLTSELPAFCAFLESYKIPLDMRSERFGVTHYHHPDLLAELDASTPERRLLNMIDAELTGPEWTGTASDLQALLTGKDSGCSYEARNLLKWSNACGTYLGRLAKKYPDRIKHNRTMTGRFWHIYPSL
jgi:hypothetical protein